MFISQLFLNPVLVGGLEHFLFFNILGIIIPIDELIFFRGVAQPPTSVEFHSGATGHLDSGWRMMRRTATSTFSRRGCEPAGRPVVFRSKWQQGLICFYDISDIFVFKFLYIVHI